MKCDGLLFHGPPGISDYVCMLFACTYESRCTDAIYGVIQQVVSLYGTLLHLQCVAYIVFSSSFNESLGLVCSTLLGDGNK